MLHRTFIILCFGGCVLLTGGPVQAQGGGSAGAGPGQSGSPRGMYFPLHHRMPPGVAGYWSGMTGKVPLGRYQPIRIELPTSGQVAVYRGRPPRPAPLEAPAQFGVAVGSVYRLRIGHMPGFPGTTLYPSIEVLDHLNPPAGRAADFPIPIRFTEEDIELALAGRLVTKVVYLEQPQLAVPRRGEEGLPVQRVPAERNLLAEADLLGRPMVVVRLGSRRPAVHGEDAEFFGTGGPVRLPQNHRTPRAEETTGPGASSSPSP